MGDNVVTVHIISEGDKILCGKSLDAVHEDKELSIHRHYVEERQGKADLDHGEMCEHCLNGFNGTTIYPDITAVLDSNDGDAFAVLGKVNRAFKAAGVHPSVRDAFRDEAMSGSYDHLLQTMFKWVDVDFVGEEESNEDDWDEDEEDDWDEDEEDDWDEEEDDE